MFTFFWGAFLIGYVTYDICHYALHHIDTSNSKDSYFHRLQQYHNQHHFSGEDNGYGVTSKLWDIIFRTELSKKIKS
jgi:sterol desaturase/sphingolipid hydroxylase (fatty acid hydroxylase superfamily)